MKAKSAVASLLLALLVASFALARQTDEGEPDQDRRSELHPSGFLGDLSDLQLHAETKGMRIYVRSEGVLAGYDRFLLEPVEVRPHPLSAAGDLDPEEVAMLAGALHEAAADELAAGGYALVDEPAPGVARVHAAITDVVPVDPMKNVGATAAGAAVGVGLLLPRLDLGQADIEVEMLDAATGERLVAVIATRGGKRFGGKIKGAKRWGDVKAAFKHWAKQIRKRPDEVHTHPRQP